MACGCSQEKAVVSQNHKSSNYREPEYQFLHSWSFIHETNPDFFNLTWLFQPKKENAIVCKLLSITNTVISITVWHSLQNTSVQNGHNISTHTDKINHFLIIIKGHGETFVTIAFASTQKRHRHGNACYLCLCVSESRTAEEEGVRSTPVGLAGRFKKRGFNPRHLQVCASLKWAHLHVWLPFISTLWADHSTLIRDQILAR